MKRLGLCVMAVAVGGFGQSGALPSTPNAADSKEILRRAPLALLALVLYPIVWLLLLPFRIVGIAVHGVLALVWAVVTLPARLLSAPFRLV